MKTYGKFKDAGRLEKDYNKVEVSGTNKKPKTKTVHQRIKVDAKGFPYLHDKNIGDECEILCRVKKVSESVPNEYEIDKDNSIEIEILQIAEPKETDDYKELIAGEEKNIKKEMRY